MTDIVHCGMCVIQFVYHYFVPWQSMFKHGILMDHVQFL